MSIELISLIVFILLMSAFLVAKRKNIEIQKMLFPFLYFILYKTKLGLKTMDRIAARFSRQIKYINYIAVFIGFAGMALISFLLVWNLWKAYITPEAIPAVGLVLPVKVKGAFFVPFFYWIISILIIATVHEFSHGIVARKFGLKLKSSGFAFLAVLLPIIPAAFVEPDEKALKKRPHKQQLAVFAAGPFSNIVLGAVILGIFLLAAPPIVEGVYDFNGAEIIDIANESPAFAAGLSVNETIVQANGENITYVEDFISALSNKSAGDEIFLVTDRGEYSINLEQKPGNENQSYLGVSLTQGAEFKEKFAGRDLIPKSIIWILGLFYWLYLLNIGIGVFNLVPVGPIDGGRMLQLVCRKVFKRKGDKYWKAISMIFLIVIIANLLIGFAK